MNLLAHRGFWRDPAEKNGRAAFERALSEGYGIETDVRDMNGTVVISHEPPGHAGMTLDALLELYITSKARSCLALNVKADGLQDLIRDRLRDFGIANYFLFDMSVPDLLRYFDNGLKVYTRRSEYEFASLLDEKAAGIWLDAFIKPFVNPTLLDHCLCDGRSVALVSPELHGKTHAEAWEQWRKVIRKHAGRFVSVSLCTDIPDEAADFFSGC